MANGNSESNVIQLRSLEKELDTLKHTGSGNGGGEPPMELLERVIKIESKLPSLATNEALIRETGLLRSDLNREIGQLRADLNKEVGLLRSDLNKEVGALRADFQKEIGGIKTEIQSARADLEKSMKDQIFKFFGIFAVLVTLLVTVARFGPSLLALF